MNSTLNNSTSDDEWTVVVSRKPPRKLLLHQQEAKPKHLQVVDPESRRGGQGEKTRPNPRQAHQQERRTQNPRQARQQEQQWKPNPRLASLQEQRHNPKDLRLNPERQGRLLQKMEFAIWNIRRSKFYTTFFEQLKSPEVSQQFRLLLGNQTQLPMVIYGLGKIEPQYRAESRIQLSIALSMKREFDWIGDIQVFDPTLSPTECSVLQILGCTVLSLNEAYAHREAKKPTLFFVPQFSPTLCSNILQANLRTDGLSKMVLLGNSLKSYKDDDEDAQIIEARRRITGEFAIEKASGDFRAFDDLSWHFFSPGSDTIELPVLDFGLFPALIK